MGPNRWPRALVAGSVLIACAVAMPAQNEEAAKPTVMIGLLTRTGPDDPATQPILAGASLQATETNDAGGVDGSQVMVAQRTTPDERAVRAAVEKMIELGFEAVIAPFDPELARAARRAADDEIACIVFGARRQDVVATIDRVCARTLLIQRIGFAHDRDRRARALRKYVEEDGVWTPPTRLVVDFDLGIRKKKLDKELEEHPIDLLVVDGPADEVAEFLAGEAWAGRDIPTILTPRAYGPETGAAAGGETFVVLGQSPATHSAGAAFRKPFEAEHGLPGFGAAEGYEAVQLAVRAVDATDGTHDPAAIRRALAEVVAEGARGRIRIDEDDEFVRAPLALWRVGEHGVAAYAPPVIPLAAAEAGTKVGEREPDPTFGDPFRRRRAREFVQEEGAYWVVFDWGLEGEQTIDEDLRLLGLSTGGKHPLIDRIVKDELMARLLSICSTKFGRAPDGSPIEGKSLAISLGTWAPRSKKRMWRAHVAGDDSSAGGRAFGTYCYIYSSFIRRTIFQPHALEPALSPDDLAYLDGSYVFGTDHRRDKRSELIRALIQGYAGSMALTAAHEIGHLCGLGHVTDDPTGIMNVAEGAGLHHDEAAFSAGSHAKLVEKLGYSGEDPRERRRRRGQ